MCVCDIDQHIVLVKNIKGGGGGGGGYHFVLMIMNPQDLVCLQTPKPLLIWNEHQEVIHV